MTKYVYNLYEQEAPYGEAGDADFDAVMAEHAAFSQAIVAAGGTVVGGEALRSVKSATFLRGTRTQQVHVIDNPLPEVTEVLGGFYVVELPGDDASTHDLAVELGKLAPAGYGYVEVRTVWDLS